MKPHRAVLGILVVMHVLSHNTDLSGAEDAAAVAVPEADAVLQSLSPEHPRLLADAEHFEQLRQRIQTDEHARRFWEAVHAEADRLLDADPVAYEIPDGLRLLSVSREAVDRIYTLALAFQITGDRKYVDRAWEEMRTISAFEDWNPKHFLDTAEMTHALAIGYDWLYHELSEEQRKTIREAIMQKGIKPALAAYDNQTTYSGAIWWRDATHNWNQVCGGGIGLGALAIAEDHPDAAGRVLHEALTRLVGAMEEYAPDGGYPEGPGYWSYGTRYNVYFLAGLDTALGKTFGLTDLPGFAATGSFPIHMTGPTGNSFNFADVGRNDAVREPALFWLARQYEQPAYALYQRQVARPAKPWNLLWYDPQLVADSPDPLPRDVLYKRIHAGVFRERWNDPDAMFLGFKGGDNKFNHSNLDLGSFVFEADGHRWAIDLGKDDYNLPGYWQRGMEGTRWGYYRLRAEGHNTLVINPDQRGDQDDRAAAPATLVADDTRERSTATIGLTDAYARHDAKRVERRFIMNRERRRVDIHDRVELNEPGTVRWFMHTPAKITLNDAGDVATLHLGDQTLRVALHTVEADAPGQPGATADRPRFQIMDAAPLPTSPDPEGQAANDKVRKLAISIKGVKTLNLIVTLTPERD